jgi:S1-C subfamily serine protease
VHEQHGRTGLRPRLRAGAVAAAALLAAAAGGAAERTLAELFVAVDPAVVEVLAARRGSAGEGGGSEQAASLGSGFLISKDGRIMTAAHVVEVADRVAVRFVTGEVMAARILALDTYADVALVQAESVPAGIAPVAVGNSDAVRVGEQVFIIGAPYGISHSLSVGHVSARRTTDQLLGGIEGVEVLQTDAAINQGNSGGPMFSMRGEVVGIVSSILSTGGGSQGIGFVVTSNLAMRLLIDEPTAWTGLKGRLVDGELARALNLPQRAGILVEAVATGSPASALGLRAGGLAADIAGEKLTLGGDVILAVHGIRIGEPDFRRRIRDRGRELGDHERVELELLRGGAVIRLGSSPAALGGR